MDAGRRNPEYPSGAQGRRRALGWPGPEGNEEDRVQDFSDGRFLKNPLPVPKRKPHVRMEFDLLDDWDIPRGQEHFDVEIDEDDDFDL